MACIRQQIYKLILLHVHISMFSGKDAGGTGNSNLIAEELREQQCRQSKCTECSRKMESYREKGLNNVCLDGAERLVFDDNEDLLLFFQVDEVTKPGFLGKSVGIDKTNIFFPRMMFVCCSLNSVCLL